MRDTEAALTDDVDVAARLDLVTYLLRCTGDVAVVSAPETATIDAAVPALVRAVAGDRETAAVVIDSATANHAERLATRLMLDSEQRPGDAEAAVTLANRLKERHRSLAVIVPDAHGLPVPLVRDLVILGRRIAARGAAMPLALICPEAEAGQLQALVQETGRDAEQVHHIRLQAPEDPRPMPLMERRRFNPLWIALPVAALVAGLIGLQQWASAPEPTGADGTATPATDTPGTVTHEGTDRERPSGDPDTPVTDDLARETEDRPADTKPPRQPAELTGLPEGIVIVSPMREGTLPPVEDIVATRQTIERTVDGTSTGIPAREPTTDETRVATSRQTEASTGDSAASDDDTSTPGGATADAPQTTDAGKDAQPTTVAATPGTDESSTPGDNATASGTGAGNDDTGAADTERQAEPDSQGWLESRPANHYTLQLIAGRQEATTRRFLANHPDVREQARVVELDGSDGRWFLVLLGDYPSRSAAMAAVPESIGADNVYARSFASIRR